MSRIELAPEVSEDSDRILEHLSRHEGAEIASRVQEIVQPIAVLELNPLIGRPARADLRELVIGRGSKGYVALYRHVSELDIVFVLAVRSRREAGYKRL